MTDDEHPDRTCEHGTSVYERCWDCCPGEEELPPLPAALEEGLLDFWAENSELFKKEN